MSKHTYEDVKNTVTEALSELTDRVHQNLKDEIMSIISQKRSDINALRRSRDYVADTCYYEEDIYDAQELLLDELTDEINSIDPWE